MTLLLTLILSACSNQTYDDANQPPAAPAQEIVQEATPEPDLAQAPKAAEPAQSAVVAPPTPVTRRDCAFVDPNRTQDQDGHVVVKCGDEIFSATAVYKEDGAFEFTLHSPSAAQTAAPDASTSPPDAVGDAK